MATPDLSGSTASWMNDGTVPKDSGFNDWMRNFAYDSFKSDADSWLRQNGSDPNDVSTINSKYLTPDGKAVDYSKIDLGGDSHSYQGYLQELGEGSQGKTLYDMYQNGLQTSAMDKTYAQNSPFTPGAFGSQYKGTIAQPLFNHQYQTGMDDGAFGFDPNLGFRTSASNVHSSEGAGADKAWNIAGAMAPGLIMAPALAAVMGPAMAGLVKSGMSFGSGGMNNINPMSLAGTALGAFGGDLLGSIPGGSELAGGVKDAMGAIPEAIKPFISPAIQLALSRGQINPFQLAMMLGRQAPNMFGGR